MEGRTPTPLECIAWAEWFERIVAEAGSRVAREVVVNLGREVRAIAALSSEAERAESVMALSVWMRPPSPDECLARAEWFERLADDLGLGSAVIGGVFRKRGEEWRAIAALTSEAERAQTVMAMDILDAQRFGDFLERTVSTLSSSATPSLIDEPRQSHGLN